MKLTKTEKEWLIQRFTRVVNNWHGHRKYPHILLEMLELHNNKSNDYASEENPFANLELCERGGIPAWKGVIIRLGDKYSRLLNAMTGKLLKFEGIRDTFLDNAVYSIIGLIEYEKYKKEEKKKQKKTLGKKDS